MTEKMKRKSTKQKWLNPEMTRVKLNPEQGVLSCCDNTGRGLQATELTMQCTDLIGCTGTVPDGLAS
jgi:hypothetical protein